MHKNFRNIEFREGEVVWFRISEWGYGGRP